MKYLKEIAVHSRQRAEFIKLDAQVEKAIAESGAKDGVCHIYVPHTTAGVTINEGADPAVAADILAKLEQLVPRNAAYTHVEGNADSHIKAALVGSSAMVLVRDSRPALGTWQSIFFCEFGDKENTVTRLTDRARALWLGDIGTEPGPPSADGEDAANSIACPNQRQAK